MPGGPATIPQNTVNGLPARLAELSDVATLASAATITLPRARVITMTGTTTVTSITAGRAGREVVLLVTTALQFTDGSNLHLAGNFVGNAAGGTDSLSLVSDGTNWIETGRSVN